MGKRVRPAAPENGLTPGTTITVGSSLSIKRQPSGDILFQKKGESQVKIPAEYWEQLLSAGQNGGLAEGVPGILEPGADGKSAELFGKNTSVVLAAREVALLTEAARSGAIELAD